MVGGERGLGVQGLEGEGFRVVDFPGERQGEGVGFFEGGEDRADIE